MKKSFGIIALFACLLVWGGNSGVCADLSSPQAAISAARSDASAVPQVAQPQSQVSLQSSSGLGGMNFIDGANYPWVNYGWDFGATAWGHRGVADPASRAKVASDFAYLHSRGVKVVRWFLMADGKAAPLVDSKGMVTGFDYWFYPDMDAALDIAKANGIKIIFVLFDFSLVDTPSVVNGVQSGGRANFFSDDAVAKSLMDNALLPMFKRYGSNSSIFAWEIMNEPEMRLDQLVNVYGKRIINYDRFCALAKQIVSAVHSSTSQMVTIGSFSSIGLSQWKGLGLDFYEFHYYEYMSKYLIPYPVKASSLGLDKPCILGEFQTKGGSRYVEAYMQDSLDNGLAGAFPWSMNASDSYSDFTPWVADRYLAWAQAHP
jgi:hypothetical protein